LLFQPTFFDYERYVISPSQQQALEDNRQLLLQHLDMRVVIEGYCGDHGSTEYNLALAEERADAAKQALVQAEVSPDRITTASFGKQNSRLRGEYRRLFSSVLKNRPRSTLLLCSPE